MHTQNLWAIILAGGDGNRLRSLTSDGNGGSVPKQFCSLDGGPLLLEMALRRAERLAPTERIMISVTDAHRPWWQRDLEGVPHDNIVRQPSNRGTLSGVLLPLLEIYARDPDARVIVIPSDHFVVDEATLELAARSAVLDLTDARDEIVLLGVEPETPDPDFGWIIPTAPAMERSQPVERFVEKPDAHAAAALRREGAVVNSFIFAARAVRLLGLCESLESIQFWSLRFGRWNTSLSGAGNLVNVYRQLPNGDFSRDILQRATNALRVRTVPPCGWSDLGTPERVAQWARRVNREGGVPKKAHGMRPILADNALAMAVR